MKDSIERIMEGAKPKRSCAINSLFACTRQDDLKHASMLADHPLELNIS